MYCISEQGNHWLGSGNGTRYIGNLFKIFTWKIQIYWHLTLSNSLAHQIVPKCYAKHHNSVSYFNIIKYCFEIWHTVKCVYITFTHKGRTKSPNSGLTVLRFHAFLCTPDDCMILCLILWCLNHVIDCFKKYIHVYHQKSHEKDTYGQL